MDFSFSTFKGVMDISDVSQETYAFILRGVFQYVKKVHVIDLDDYTDGVTGEEEDIPFDLQYAVFRHAKHIYDVQMKNTDNVDSAKDSGGNATKYISPKMPSIITSTYRMYSPSEPIIL